MADALTDMAVGSQDGSGNRARRMGRALSNIPGAGVVFAPPRVARYALDTWWRYRQNGAGSEAALDGVMPRLSWSLAAQVAIDETVLALAKSPRWYPRDEELVGVAAEMRAALALARRRGWLESPASYHREPASLSDVRVESMSFGDLRYQMLSWDSGYEPYPGEPGRDRWMGYGANATAYARVLRHPGRPRPWLICLHGFGTGTALTDFNAFRAERLFHGLGLNVVIPVLPLHGLRRASRLGGIEMMSFQLQNFVLGMAHAMWDVRRVVRWVREQGATRVGVHGQSFGSYTGALLATLEPDLDMVIAGVPLADVPALFASHTPRRVLGLADRHGINAETTERLFRVVSPLAAPPLVRHEALFMYAGVGDRMSRPEQAHRLWEHWGRPKIVWYPGSHMTFLWSRAVNEFLDEALVRAGFVSRRRVRATPSPDMPDAAVRHGTRRT